MQSLSEKNLLKKVSEAAETGNEGLLKQILRSLPEMNRDMVTRSLELLPYTGVQHAEFPTKPQTPRDGFPWWK